MQTERFLHLIDIRAHLREIESHDEKLVMYRRRMLPDIQIAEQFVELVGIPNVIISLQHRQRQTFPEAPGTDQEQIRRLHFYLFDKHRLIHIIIVFFLDATEIRQSVWYLLYHIVIPFFIHHSYRSKYTEKRMNVTRLMPLIYPFIRYFVQKRLSGGKLPFRGKTAIRGKTTTPTPSAPEAAGVLNFLCALRPNTPPPNIPLCCWRSFVIGNDCFPVP